MEAIAGLKWRGLDRSGKSTQSKKLEEYLSKAGRDVPLGRCGLHMTGEALLVTGGTWPSEMDVLPKPEDAHWQRH